MKFTRRQTLGLALAGCLPASAQAAAVAWPARTELLDGQVLDAQAWQGQPLLVVFWATHCPFCLRHNAKLHQLLQASPGLRVLAVAQDRDPALVRRYMARHSYQFPVTLDAQAWRAALAVKRVLPTTVPINRAGQAGLALPGEMFAEDLAEMAQWALR